MRVEHFEPCEHQLCVAMVQAAVGDALRSASGNNHALIALETPTVLHFFPAAVRPDGFWAWMEPTSRRVRHIAVFVCFGVRYADDIVILTDSEEQAQEALANMADFMHHPLRLELKPAKTNHVTVKDGFDFLGFRLDLEGVEVQQAIAMNISVSLQLKLTALDIPVVFAPPVSEPMAVLNPVRTEKSHLRGLQVLRRDDPDIIEAGLDMLSAKVGNQAADLHSAAQWTPTS